MGMDLHPSMAEASNHLSPVWSQLPPRRPTATPDRRPRRDRYLPSSMPDIQDSRICTRVEPVPTMAKSGVKKKRKSTHSPRSRGRSGVPGAGWG